MITVSIQKILSDKRRGLSPKTEKLLLFGIAIFWGVITVFLVICHEPWRDEAQSYLLARDLSFAELFSVGRLEGHPCLWYALNVVFIKLGAPIYIQNIISLLLCFAAVVLLLFKSPLPLELRILAAFSPGFLYYFPVIARGYALVPLILFSLALFFPSRHEHPWRYAILLALLVQTFVPLLMMAFALSLWFLIERIVAWKKTQKRYDVTPGSKALAAFLRYILPLALPLCSACFLVFELFPNNNDVQSPYQCGSIAMAIRIFAILFQNVEIGSIFLVLLGAVLISGIVWGGYKTCIVSCVLLSSYLFMFWFSSYIYALDSIQKMMLFPLLLIWYIWMTIPDLFFDYKDILPRHYVARELENHPQETICPSIPPKTDPAMKKTIAERNEAPESYFWKRRPLLFSWLTTVAVLSLLIVIYEVYISADVVLPYSNARACAEFINQNVPSDAVLLTNDEAYGASIIPYLTDRRTLIDAGSGEEFSYAKWDHYNNEDWQASRVSFSERIALIQQNCPDAEIYIIYADTAYFDVPEDLSDLDVNIVDTSLIDSIVGEDFAVLQVV